MPLYTFHVPAYTFEAVEVDADSVELAHDILADWVSNGNYQHRVKVREKGIEDRDGRYKVGDLPWCCVYDESGKECGSV